MEANVYVTNLLASLSPLADSLREYFCKYGEIKECMVMKDPVTRRSR